MEKKLYISTRVLPLRQISNKEMLIGKLTVDEIVSIIRYTDRKVLPIDPLQEDYDANNLDQQYYQRVKSSDRAYDIKLFIIKQLYNLYTYKKNQVSPLAVFPSAIILSCATDDSIDDVEDFENIIKLNQKEKTLTEIALVKESRIYLPLSKNTLVVDGQHRIAGIENLLQEAKAGQILLKKSDVEIYEPLLVPTTFILETLQKFEFLITFLIDFDRYEQAELFANVNFNQKPVNKSFYYDIFGTAQRGRSIVKLLHDLTANLNFNASSPLHEKIKMLGSGPGFFSQAFIVEALLPLFKKGVFFSIYVDYQERGSDYKQLPKFFRAYFSAFFEVFKDYYPNSILVKTTGMGAIVNLMPWIFGKVKERGSNPLFMEERDIKSVIKKIITPISLKGESYFGPQSGFASGGSKGLQNRLYRKMLADLT